MGHLYSSNLNEVSLSLGRSGTIVMEFLQSVFLMLTESTGFFPLLCSKAPRGQRSLCRTDSEWLSVLSHSASMQPQSFLPHVQRAELSRRSPQLPARRMVQNAVLVTYRKMICVWQQLVCVHIYNLTASVIMLSFLEGFIAAHVPWNPYVKILTGHT